MEEHRLRPKYSVYKLNVNYQDTVSTRMESTDPDNVNSPFVLMPRKDPAAFGAMVAYMDLCEPQLANEIRTWLRKIAQVDPVYGTQGKRNRAAIRMRMMAGAD